MFPVSKKNSQAGFSLVELMVVVAIIGILAAIAVPNMQKYMAKSRQSEAKSNLAAVYTSQKAFNAEYGVYFAGLKTTGFMPEGALRYNIGFSSAVPATAPVGAALAAGDQNNTLALCAWNAPITSVCRTVPTYNNAQPGAITAATITANGFDAQARAIISSSNVVDLWQIDENKALRNVTSGL